jgi:CheY-like chemotaxis protein
MSDESANLKPARDEPAARKTVILFVEDHSDDSYICQTAFKRAKLNVELRVVRTAREGIDWLSGNTPFNNRELFPVPDIVISDIQTTDMTGTDLLRWARTIVVYHQLPIIIHSGIMLPGDSAECMKLGATACLQKEPQCQPLVETVKRAIERL